MNKATAWPIEEATKLLPAAKRQEIVFETGYGPSGLPHIGTFGEVVRTIMVMRALSYLHPAAKMRLICFSDDMDGLRKVPDNIPDPEKIGQYIGYALTSIPDPFGTHESYGAHMNARLCNFLDLFGFEYELKSATQCYKSGLFNDQLRDILRMHNEVLQIVLPSLGEERQQTYSPFLPVSEGKVLQAKVVELKESSIVYEDPDSGELVETEVTDGKCKLQWKVDWGMRWAALGVNFEFHGKDLTPSAEVSKKICGLLNRECPVLSVYELFLDEEGKKISKSKGNGLTIEQWLKYAPWETLAFFMFQNPKRAKRLYFDVIPRNVDEYLKCLSSFTEGDMCNPLSYIDVSDMVVSSGVTYSLLLNLVSVCNTDDEDVLWGFIHRYNSSASRENNILLARLVRHAISYYRDFVAPHKEYKVPDEGEMTALKALSTALENADENSSGEEIQNIVYAVGKQNGYQSDIKGWFSTLYRILNGQNEGPRIGSFFCLYGLSNSVKMIESILSKYQS